MRTIVEATRIADVRVLLAVHWYIDTSSTSLPDHIFLLPRSTPYDYILPYVSCVIHHGDPAVTSIGLRYDKPTAIVPFFGEQAFWGRMVYRAGVGPKPIRHRYLTQEVVGKEGKGVLLLRRAIDICRSDVVRHRAEVLGAKIRQSVRILSDIINR
jgi:sterol 3beta-glucosyltransferase